MRNAMYAFFERTLNGVANPSAELEAAGIATEPLATLGALDLADVPRDLATVRSEFRERLRATALTARQITGAAAEETLSERRRHLARLLLDPKPATPRWNAKRTIEWRGHKGHVASIATEEEIALPVVVFEPIERSGPCPLALVIGTRGKATLLAIHGTWIKALLDRGYTVAVADVRYTGELDVGRNWRDPYGKIFGRDEGALAVQDIRAAIRVLTNRPDVRADGVLLVAFDDHGAAALFAAALDERIGCVVAPQLGQPYAQNDRRPKIVRVLRHGDLPDAACLVAPRKIIAGGTSATAFASAGRRYAALDQADHLVLQAAPLELDAVLAALDL